MVATALDLSQIKTDALSSAATFRSLIELGISDTPTFKGSTLTGGTVTASTPVIDATQTWNDAAVTFTGMKLDVTDTASASDSKLLDLQVGGASKFSVDKAGNAVFAKNINIGSNRSLLSGGTILVLGPSYLPGWVVTYGAAQTGRDGSIGWSSTTDIAYTPDLRLYRDAAGTLAQRNGTNAQEYRLYNTYTDASNYERAFLKWDANTFKIGTEAAGTGAARNLQIDADKVGFGIDPSVTFHIQANDGQIRISDPDSTSTANARGYFEVYHQNTSRAGYFGLITQTEMAIATGNVAGRFAVLTGSNQFALTIDSSQNSRFYGDLELRDGTNSTAFTLYNTYTDASNYERGFVKWDNNVLKFGGESAGTGSATRTVQLTGDRRVYLGSPDTGNGIDIFDYLDNTAMLFCQGGNNLVELRPAALKPHNQAQHQMDLGDVSYNDRWRTAYLGGTTVTSATPMLDLAQTWNDAVVTFTGMKMDVTDTASASDSKLLDLQVGGTSKFSVDKDGRAYVAKINGSTSSAADPSTTEYPNDGDHGIHKNTTSGNVFLAYNDGGSSIVKVQLS